MKLVRPNSIEWKSFFALMPLIAFCTCFVFFGSNWYNDTTTWLFGFGYMMLSGLFVWYLDVCLTRYIHDKYFAYRDTVKRLATLLVKQVIVTSISVSVMMIGVNQMQLEGFTAGSDVFGISLAIALGFTFIAMLTWEGNYIFMQWKESLMEKEKYAQLGLQSEFDTLKSQVNPHFLFNCFNTLSSLITEDKQKAEIFLNDLSKVYRYLLRNNQNGLSSLKNEIEFIRSYYELLRTRHGEAVQMQVEIDKRYDNYLLPSLSLQMLVENAVKHNALSKNYPLTIEIFTTVGNKLVVNNTIRRRAQKAPSGKIGLNNIQSKYGLLKQPGFQVMQDEQHFTVVLPLIWERLLDGGVV